MNIEQSLPDSFRNVIFDIIPGNEAGKFEVNAKFLGVDMERFQLHYQVRRHSHESSRHLLSFRCWPQFPRSQMTSA
jgi:hypothetical protein